MPTPDSALSQPVRRGRPRGSRNKPNLPDDIPVPSLPPVAMRVEAAARYVGISRSYMKKLITKGRVRSTKIGRTRLVFTASLHELLQDGM